MPKRNPKFKLFATNEESYRDFDDFSTKEGTLMNFGADYYPEQWPEDRWVEDARLMAQASMNTVRMAEFAWSIMEPEDGIFDFSLFDRAIDVVGKEGIKTILGTPSATPPKWLIDKHPEILQTDRMGRIRGFGSRRHTCFSSKAYWKYSQRIAEKMVQHFQGNEFVIGWQIDNELGCHDHRCYCETCRTNFIEWLKKKYGTLEELNSSWGTRFWSQVYSDWNQLILPAYTQCDTFSDMSSSFTHNPGLMLDFFRFTSDIVVDFQNMQIDTIRQHSSLPVTHNYMGNFQELDYFDLGKNLDFISWDNYLDFQWGRVPRSRTALAHSRIRGIKQQNFWVMEQQSGPCGWNTFGATPKPGQLRLWTYQAIAHGADGILYFRWRTARFGIEQNWYGVLDHDGIPRRRYEEISQIGHELVRLAPYLQDSQPKNSIAILQDYSVGWSHRFQPGSRGLDYQQIVAQWYEAFYNQHIGVDVISSKAHEFFSQYSLLVVPVLNLVTSELAEQLSEFVNQGGTLVLTFLSGTKDANNGFVDQPLPGVFSQLAGVEVEEFMALNSERQVTVSKVTQDESPMLGTASLWCEILNPKGAEVYASYANEFFSGKPAITKHLGATGLGSTYYVGCDLDQPGLLSFVIDVCSDLGLFNHVKPKGEGERDSGLEIVVRTNEQTNKNYLFLMNHSETEIHLDVDELLLSLQDKQGKKTILNDCLLDETVSEIISLKSFDVKILEYGSIADST